MASPAYGSLAQNARAQQLKSAKIILWFVAVINIGFSGFAFSNAENELNTEIQKAGMSRAMVDPAKYTEALGQMKLIYGAGIGLGVLFAGCALLINRMPVVATVSGLVLFLGVTAVIAATDPGELKNGIVMRVAIIIGLISAMKAAIAVERQERAEKAGLGA